MRNYGLTFTGLLLLSISIGLKAHDLVLQDTSVLKVSPCDRQIRLTVRMDGVEHKHLSGSQTSGPYRIDVSSPSRNRQVMEFMVENHDPGETLFFVVPSQKLSCDSNVVIRVDADNVVTETNEKNNVKAVPIERPKASAIFEACPMAPDCK